MSRQVLCGWSDKALRHWLVSLDGQRVPLSAEERGARQGIYPYYGASGVIDHIDDYLFDEPLVLVAEDGANLLLRSTPIAFIARGQYWVNNHAHVLRPLGGSARFWAYRLSSIDVSPLVSGSAQPKLTASALMNMRVAAPESVDEQRAIADYLDRETARIDTLIEEQQRLIEMLRERREAVVRRSIPDHRLISHAVVDKLGRNARIGNGSTPRREEQSFWTGGHVPWLNSAVVNQERVTAADQFVTEEARAKCHLPLVPRGALLVALTGQGKTRGKATVLDIEATINQHMAYVVPDSDHWNSEYLLWCLIAAYDELRSISDETGSTKGALTCEDLKRFRIVHVPLDEQRRIVAYLDEQTAKIDALIAETERFIELSRERRSALITAAVTGQIDVRQVA